METAEESKAIIKPTNAGSFRDGVVCTYNLRWPTNTDQDGNSLTVEAVTLENVRAVFIVTRQSDNNDYRHETLEVGYKIKLKSRSKCFITIVSQGAQSSGFELKVTFRKKDAGSEQVLEPPPPKIVTVTEIQYETKVVNKTNIVRKTKTVRKCNEFLPHEKARVHPHLFLIVNIFTFNRGKCLGVGNVQVHSDRRRRRCPSHRWAHLLAPLPEAAWRENFSGGSARTRPRQRQASPRCT
jgi:hypothetical protein